MIHSVAVPAGESNATKAALRHAVQMALWFRARLRAVLTWEVEEAQRAVEHGAPGDLLQTLIDEEIENLAEAVGEARLAVERSVHGEGLVSGALAVAQESDLLVVGIDDYAPEEHDLLRGAESLVLAVHLPPPQRLQRILVDYPGGAEGKAALRVAGEIALRAKAAVTVLCVSGDAADAGVLAATAGRYLEAFGLPAVETIEHRGSPDSKNEVLHAARSVTADLIVLGQERHGSFEGLLHGDTVDATGLAEDILLPVLIAR